MRKLLVIIGILLAQYASAKSIFNEFNTQILEINGRTAVIQNSEDIVIGSSGIVIHTFENGVSTILARADVVKKDGDKATIRFEIYKLSTQNAFPKPGILPRVGDTVKLNYLYNRALIVAPSFNVFKEVTTHFDKIDWIHPDLVAAYLAKAFKPNPDRKVFQKICRINSAGLIFFALSTDGYFVDCENFKVLKKVKTGLIKQAQVPFYSRVKDIDTSWINWNSSQITDYNAHYRNLIRK